MQKSCALQNSGMPLKLISLIYFSDKVKNVPEQIEKYKEQKYYLHATELACLHRSVESPVEWGKMKVDCFGQSWNGDLHVYAPYYKEGCRRRAHNFYCTLITEHKLAFSMSSTYFSCG